MFKVPFEKKRVRLFDLKSLQPVRGWIMLYMFQKVLFKQFSKIQLAGLALIFAAFSFGVFKESLWSDDYPALLDTDGVTNHLIKDARPTAAVFFSLSFQLLNTAASAWFLRFLALVALLLIFLFLSKQIDNSKYQNFAVFSLAIAFCLPSFQMYIHWSITWFYPWAALAGLYAFHFWTSKGVSRKIFAVFFLVAALTIYPPAALLFFSAICVVNSLNESRIQKFFHDVVQGILLLAVSGIFAVLTIVGALKITGVSSNSRVTLLTISEIPEKIVWLLSRPLVVGLRPFVIDSPSAKIALLTAIPAFSLLALGIWLQSRNLGESIIIRAFWVAVPLLISLAPLMITPDNQIEFRILPGYSWGIAALASFYLSIIIASKVDCLNLGQNLKIIFSNVVPFVLAVVSIASINSHYTDLFQRPYQMKNTFLNAQISSCLSSGPLRNVIILPPEKPFPVLPRLGVFSMSTDLASSWVPKPNVELLLQERGIHAPVSYLEIRPLEGEISMQDCIIDLEVFRGILTKSLT